MQSYNTLTSELLQIVDLLNVYTCGRLFLTHTEPRVQIELHKNVAICLGEVIFMTVCLQGNRLMTLISQSGGIQIHYAT